MSGGDENLFVSNLGNNTVGEFNASTGAVINGAFISGLNHPDSIAVVPAPSMWSLLAGVAALGLAACRRRRARG